MNSEKYFSVENGRNIMLDKLCDLKAAIDFAEGDAELIVCVWSREME